MEQPSLDVDCSWRTRLGTCFYNRRRELRLLETLADGRVCIVLYGPRNVGKSELARYAAGHRRLPGIIIDARKARVEATGPIRPPSSLARLLLEGSRLARLVEEAVRLLAGFVSGVLVVDEFQFIGGVEELEAVCKLVQLGEYGLSMLVTVSEGAILLGLLERLQGYAHLIPVEHLDKEHARGVYDEYAEKRGCRLSFRCFWGLVGGAPGYLPLLCPLGRDGLEVWVDGLLRSLWEALVEAMDVLKAERARMFSEVYRLLTGGPPDTPEKLKLAHLLVERNIAYPAAGSVYRPQLPLYLHAVRRALKGGWPSAPKLLEEICPEAVG